MPLGASGRHSAGPPRIWPGLSLLWGKSTAIQAWGLRTGWYSLFVCRKMCVNREEGPPCSFMKPHSFLPHQGDMASVLMVSGCSSLQTYQVMWSPGLRTSRWPSLSVGAASDIQPTGDGRKKLFQFQKFPKSKRTPKVEFATYGNYICNI